MSESNALLALQRMGGVPTVPVGGQVQFNPLGAITQGISAARGETDLRQTQFNLQQSQLQPAYQAMRQLMATNPNPSWDDVNAALAQSTRIGGNVSGLVANAAEIAGKGGKPADFMRATGLGGMSPERQGELVGPQRATFQTGEGTIYGTTPGAWSANAGQFNPAGFIRAGMSPQLATDMIQVGVNPDGSPIMKPRGAAFGEPYAGGGGGGAPAGGGGGPGTSASTATNNFGNIRSPSGGFASYATPQDGVAAMASNLTAYQDQHGINTLNGITARWAPAGDGANNPGAYANTLGKLTGIDPNAQLNLHDPATLAKIIPAIAQVEHGRPMGVGGDVLSAGINAGLSGRPGGGGGAVAAGPGGQPAGPFIGATSAQPVGGGGATNVQPTGGMQYFSPTGQPIGPGGQGGAPGGPAAAPYTGYTGLPLGAGDVAKGNITRQQALEAQMNAAVSTRATLEGMEAELEKMPATGVSAGAIATIKNLLVQAGGLSQKELDRQAQGLAAQEQFEKFSALLNQQLLAGMGGQATDARQELTGAATPSSVHSTLGNMGIIHMLEGNLIATQVMGREFQSAVRAGQASPQQFDQWRDDFTKPGPDGARYDPRVFWLSQMKPQEQQTYVNSLTAKDKAQLLKNANFAEQKKWVYENPDHSMGTGY